MKAVLARLAEGQRLNAAEAEAVFAQVLEGAAGAAEIASLLTALRVRGESEDELLGAVRAARARMRGIEAPAGAMDVCGTGGDGQHTLNISTAVAFVVAACGVAVAKHGNRAISSRAGAADVLAALGIGQGPALAESSLAALGLGFLFAPDHHPGLAHAGAVRQALGFRTLFNVLGPACNPAGVRRQLVGVFARRWLEPMAKTLGALGAERVWVVHGVDAQTGAGLDEVSLAGPTEVVAWEHGALRAFVIRPADAGLAEAPLSALRGGDAAENAGALLALLRGGAGAYRDAVVLNAAAALMVAGRSDALRGAAQLAREAIDSGAALAKYEALRNFRQVGA